MASVLRGFDVVDYLLGGTARGVTRPGGRSPELAKRAAARVLAPGLDVQLSTGMRPRAGTVLDAHAIRITGVKERRRLNTLLSRILLESQTTTFPTLAPTHPARVLRASDLITEVLGRLQAPARIEAAGVARLRAVLSERRGPFFLDGEGDLRACLRVVLAGL